MAATILDVLSLVEDDEGEFVFAIEFHVATENGVGGDEEIVLVALFPLRRAVGAGEVQRPQVGREFRGFAQPVGDERGGADDEHSLRRRSIRCPEPGRKGQRLQRLAETHIVREKAVEILRGQPGQPLHALHLVGTQLRRQLFVQAGTHLGALGHRRGARGAEALGGQRLGQKGREGSRDAHLAGLLIDGAIGQHLAHFAPRLGRYEQDALVRRAGVTLPGLQPALDFVLIQRDRLAADGKLEIETEPILPGTGAQGKFGHGDIDLTHGGVQPRAKGDGPGLPPLRQGVGDELGDRFFLAEAVPGGTAAHGLEARRRDLREGPFFCRFIAPPEAVGLTRIRQVIALGRRRAFAERKFVGAVAHKEIKGEAGKSAFQPRLERGLADFQAEFLEAGGEGHFAGAFEFGEFAGEEGGDFPGPHDARVGRKAGGP